MLLKNGHLIDPATKTNEPVDIRGGLSEEQ